MDQGQSSNICKLDKGRDPSGRPCAAAPWGGAAGRAAVAGACSANGSVGHWQGSGAVGHWQMGGKGQSGRPAVRRPVRW